METKMAKTPKFETATEAVAAPFEAVQKAFEQVTSKIEVPAAARDFVVRNAAVAQERVVDVQVGATNLTASVEKAMVSLAGGYATVTRGLIDATYENVKHALSTVEKVAQAKSLNEALQLQADYVREASAANLNRARDAAETVKTVVTDGAKTVQAEIAKIMPAKKAA
jgi:hypothetical protein